MYARNLTNFLKNQLVIIKIICKSNYLGRVSCLNEFGLCVMRCYRFELYSNLRTCVHNLNSLFYRHFIRLLRWLKQPQNKFINLMNTVSKVLHRLEPKSLTIASHVQTRFHFLIQYDYANLRLIRVNSHTNAANCHTRALVV